MKSFSTAIYLVVIGLSQVGASSRAASTVSVMIENVRNDHGTIRLELCTPSEGLAGPCKLRTSMSAQAGDHVIRVDDVPSGIYAAMVWHDENNTGWIKRDLLGVPKAGVGYSGDGEPGLGRPEFEGAAFEVRADAVEVVVRLHYSRR